MLRLGKLHHIAIICADYKRSKAFYTEVLGFKVINELYRAERNSYKLDLALNDDYLVELFSFPDPVMRPSYPEATGLRHIAFEVDDVERAIASLNEMNVITEPVRTDELTGRRFTFFSDPDGLPIELYEI
jgi:glyoxylase I family protein